MTDWATDFIHTRFDMHQPLTVETVAGWLREAREGALEEAAREVETCRHGTEVDAIRSLKDKT